MGKKLYVRITTDGPAGPAKIVNAETGEPIRSVKHVSIDMLPGGPFLATLTVLAEVDMVAEAVIEPAEIVITAHDGRTDAVDAD